MWAKNSEVIYSIVGAITIDVIEMKYKWLAIPKWKLTTVFALI
jgi:hypothetical protein